MSIYLKAVLHALIILIMIVIAVLNHVNDKLILIFVLSYAFLIGFGKILLFIPKYNGLRKKADQHFKELLKERIKNKEGYSETLFNSRKIQLILSDVFLIPNFNIEKYNLSTEEKILVNYV